MREKVAIPAAAMENGKHGIWPWNMENTAIVSSGMDFLFPYVLLNMKFGYVSLADLELTV